MSRRKPAQRKKIKSIPPSTDNAWTDLSVVPKSVFSDDKSVDKSNGSHCFKWSDVTVKTVSLEELNKKRASKVSIETESSPKSVSDQTKSIKISNQKLPQKIKNKKEKERIFPTRRICQSKATDLIRRNQGKKGTRKVNNICVKKTQTIKE